MTYERLKDRLKDQDASKGTENYDNLQVKVIITGTLHSKVTSIDGKMLIAGSMNMDLSSWGGNSLQNLAEYDIAVDYSNPDSESAVTQFDEFFNTEWNSKRYLTPKIYFSQGSPGANQSRAAQSATLTPTTEITLQDLVSQAEPNTMIILPEGTYQESVVITKPLRIIGLGKDTIIEPPAGEPAIQISSNDVSIYNLTIRNSISYGIVLADDTANSLEDILIRKVFFDNNTVGGVLIENLNPAAPIIGLWTNQSLIEP